MPGFPWKFPRKPSHLYSIARTLNKVSRIQSPTVPIPRESVPAVVRLEWCEIDETADLLISSYHGSLRTLTSQANGERNISVSTTTYVEFIFDGRPRFVCYSREDSISCWLFHHFRQRSAENHVIPIWSFIWMILDLGTCLLIYHSTVTSGCE